MAFEATAINALASGVATLEHPTRPRAHWQLRKKKGNSEANQRKKTRQVPLRGTILKLYLTQNGDRAFYYSNPNLSQKVRLGRKSENWHKCVGADCLESLTVSRENGNMSVGQSSGVRYRFYSPELGRYVTSDPIGMDGGFNFFGYAFQNPNSYFDQTGEVVPLAVILAVAARAAATAAARAAARIAALCALYPKTCKSAMKCISNPRRCNKRTCKAINRAAHQVCDFSGAKFCKKRGMLCKDAHDSLNVAETCLWLRRIVNICMGGKKGKDHSEPMKQVRERVKKCKTAVKNCKGCE